MLDYKALRTLYCALVLPYISYCVEVWGNTYQSNTKSLFLLQKRVILIIFKTDYREHTNILFFCSKLLKFKELVELQTLKVLPTNLQHLFILIENEGRRRGHFRYQTARTTAKQMCTSVVGVKVWNSLQNELKQCKNIFQFKKRFKEKTMDLYEHL